MLAQWFDNEQGGGQGDSTLVDFGKQDDVTFFLMLEGILEEMAEIITDHIFPRFVDWNFGSGKYPRFKWGPLTEEAKAAIQDTFDKLAAAGPQANVTPEFMLDLEQRLAEDFGFSHRLRQDQAGPGEAAAADAAADAGPGPDDAAPAPAWRWPGRQGRRLPPPAVPAAPALPRQAATARRRSRPAGAGLGGGAARGRRSCRGRGS